MLIRFCLYGFLKNQRYFEPFLWLAFLDKGLSFFEIGVLLAIEGVTMNVLEIPSGAVTDLFGRRRSMLVSFVAYAVSFLALGLAQSYWALCGAMVLFGVGESFRTGTHKALIFEWLKLAGRGDEKTRVYGLTRSWSKYGSAVSALVGPAIVFATSSYSALFYWSMVPCVFSVINLLGYPNSIDPPPQTRASLRCLFAHLQSSARDVLKRARLRRLVFESMGFHGVFRASKDYLQPALLAAAVVWFSGEASSLDDKRGTALLVGPVYFALFIGAGIASRNAHRFAEFAGGDAAAARTLWACLTVLFAGLALASAAKVSSVVIAGFVVLFLLQNLWRPIMTSRIYDEVDEEKGATILSIDSQGQRLGTVALAPLFGFLADSADSFWPVAGLAALIGGGFFARAYVPMRNV